MDPPTPHSSQEMRRAKLEGIRNREETRHKKERLFLMLTQKLSQKYSSPKQRTLNRKIKGMVRDFVDNSGAGVSDSGLADLENEVRAAAEGSLPPVAAPAATTSSAAPAEAVAEAAPEAAQPDPADVDLGINEWNMLDMYNTITHEEEQKKAIIARKAEQAAFAKHLAGTSNARDMEEATEKAEMEKYLEEQARLTNVWRTQQKKSRAKRHAVAVEERQVRAQQIKDTNSRRKAEFDKRRAEEMEEIRRCKDAIQFTRDEEARKRREEHERLKKILIENQIENAKRAEVAKEEAAEDVRLMEEYKAKLEREDLERKRAFEKRMERYEAYGRLWADKGAGKKQREEELRIERVILREAKKKEDADIERERRDKEYLRTTALSIAASNKNLMEEKRRRMKEEHDASMIYAMSFRGEGEQYVAAERARAAARREEAKKHAAFLKEQIEGDRQRRQAVEMSDAERSVNREVLRKVKEDPEMVSRIQARLTYERPAAQKVSNIFL